MTNEMTAEEAVKELKALLNMCDPSPLTKELEDALKMAIKALEQQPSEDCISREAVIDYITANYGFCHNLIECVRALSPVTSERPKGKWIWDLRMGLHKCSVCGKFCDFDYLYCPNCGSYNGGGEDG